MNMIKIEQDGDDYYFIDDTRCVDFYDNKMRSIVDKGVAKLIIWWGLMKIYIYDDNKL